MTLFLEMPLLLVGRFVNGFGAGNFSYLVQIMCKQTHSLTLVSEISPLKVRGAISNLT